MVPDRDIKLNVHKQFMVQVHRTRTSNSWYTCKTLVDNFELVPVIQGTKLRSKTRLHQQFMVQHDFYQKSIVYKTPR